jgi:uncharacterized protein (TIGR02270 family)
VTLWNVVEEHLDEAAYLYDRRKTVLVAPSYDFEEVRRGPEARLLAHLDGLVVGGSVVRERLLVPALRDEDAEPERVAVAMLAMLRSHPPPHELELLVAGLDPARGARLNALCEALALAEAPEVPLRVVQRLATSDVPALTAPMLRVLAAHRVDPGETLRRFLQSEDPATVQAALEIAAAVPRRDCLDSCERLLGSEVVGIRDRALDAALSMGSSVAWSVCLRRARRPTAEDGHCLLLCGLLGGAEDHDGLLQLLQAGTQVPAALWSIGFAGRPGHVPALLELMKDAREPIAKLAGEAFASITGYAPGGKGGVSNPEDEIVPFEEDDLDADLAPTPVDQLPTLDDAAARAWWAHHRDGFSDGVRYVLGHPLSGGGLLRALRHGSARRRQPWALGVSIATGGQCVIPTDAFYDRQRIQLEELARHDSAERGRPWLSFRATQDPPYAARLDPSPDPRAVADRAHV